MKQELYKKGSWCYVKPYSSPMTHIHKSHFVPSTDRMGRPIELCYPPIEKGIYQIEEVRHSGGLVRYKMVGEYDSAYYDEIKFIAETKEEVEEWLKKEREKNEI